MWHMDMVDAGKVAEETARQKAKQVSMNAKQRAKDLAMCGKSKILPVKVSPNKKNPLSRSLNIPKTPTVFKRGVSLSIAVMSDMMKHDATAKVSAAITKATVALAELKEKREINLELAKARFQSQDSRTTEKGNRIVTVVAMDRVHSLHARIVQVENVLSGLKELETNIKNDIVEPDDIEIDVKEIMSLLNNAPKNVPKYTHEELVDQLNNLLQ